MELEESDDDGPVDPGAPIALAWDGALLWGAGLFGITAWEVPQARAGSVRRGH